MHKLFYCSNEKNIFALDKMTRIQLQTNFLKCDLHRNLLSYILNKRAQWLINILIKTNLSLKNVIKKN